LRIDTEYLQVDAKRWVRYEEKVRLGLKMRCVALSRRGVFGTAHALGVLLFEAKRVLSITKGIRVA
jgi:hypothetical protein